MKDYRFDRYRRMSLMFSRGIHISDVLREYGLSSIYIYGKGEMGDIVIHDLISSEIEVSGIIDIEADGSKICFFGEGRVYEFPLLTPTELPNDEIPILITPTNFFDEITESLIREGVDPKRFYSLDIVLRWGCSKIEDFTEDGYMTGCDNKEFLITGTGFSNKGSQAMCFVVANEIRKRYKNAQIWVQGFFPNHEDWMDANKTFRMSFLPEDGSLMKSVMPHLSALFDVSGYALGSTWEQWVIEGYKKRIRLAKEFRIPVYLMPQSFGPFDFTDGKEKDLEGLLSEVRMIFAREEEGYNALKERYSLSNVIKTEDMVLQHDNINRTEIYRKCECRDFLLKTKCNVAIIPNFQNIRHGARNDVIRLYQRSVELLLNERKHVYIIAHSEDDPLCREIMEPFWNEGDVFLYGKKFDCLDFEELVKNFQFMIASRFHSVVHSYRQGVPCVVIGWAEKYSELTERFGQGSYFYDVRVNIDENDFLNGIKKMDNNRNEESKKIKSIFHDIQKEKTCFDYISW